MALTYDHAYTDTIAAIATAMSEAGIGIIRISGPDAASIGSALYRTSKKKKTDISAWRPGTIRYGYIVEKDQDGRENLIDEVMVSWMKSPHSYTTEDTVEINTHGGMFLMNRILELVLKAGARMAEPGEFTKRAFLGGRIDLARAEAVMDLISSGNEFARKTSAAQLEGAVSSRIRELREKVLYEIAFIESALDDPENYSLDDYPEKLMNTCIQLEKEMKSLLSHAEEGRILREGIRTAIVGRPNVGKSSLLNHLAGEERAIVTEIEGTTRDTLSETVRVGGVLLHLTDTAGIRQTSDKVEQIGVHRAQQALENADMILFVVDSSRKISPEDGEIAERIIAKLQEGTKCIILMNKTDLMSEVTEKDVRDIFTSRGSDCPPLLFISLQTGEGMEELGKFIAELFHTGEIAEKNEIFLSNLRHKKAVQEALDSICLVEDSIRNGMSEDFFSIDLMNAYRVLGTILGEAVEDDLVEEIFSKFCMGK